MNQPNPTLFLRRPLNGLFYKGPYPPKGVRVSGVRPKVGNRGRRVPKKRGENIINKNFQTNNQSEGQDSFLFSNNPPKAS